MSSHDTELVLETWQLRERLLPRVPPDGWATVDGLRAAVCLAVPHVVDGVESIEPFEGPPADRERFEATVTVESVDDEHVRVATAAEDSSGADAGDGRHGDFDETTEQFDLDEALDRL